MVFQKTLRMGSQKPMAEENILLEKTRVKFIDSLPEPLNNPKKDWKQGNFLITNEEIQLIPDDGDNSTIKLTDVSDVGRKVKLGKLALGASRIIAIDHKNENQNSISLISTADQQHETTLKKVILKSIIDNSDIEFVSPFSQGGKILFDKQPVKGTISVEENMLQLTSEWLGKKQNENIDILNVDDFDKSIDQSKKGSLTLKYQKEGIVISTLISSNEKLINLLEKYVKILKGITDEDEEEIDLDDKQFMLLQMMYSSDINAEDAMEMLGVDLPGLEKIVQSLVQYKLLAVSGDDEFKLTEKGTKYIVAQMKKNIQNA